MMNPVITSRPPSYYVKQRLRRNKPAMAGLGIILIAFLVALLGYWILPDASPHANHSVVQLQKKPPGFSVTMLRVQNPAAPPARNLWQYWLAGQEMPYYEIPVQSYLLQGDSIRVAPYVSAHALPEPARVFSLAQLYRSPSSSLSPPAKQDLNQPAAEGLFQTNSLYRQTYWLGTDRAGRDVLSRLLLGTRISLGIGLVAVLISVSLGVVVGAAAGYFGGWIDRLMLFLMTVVWAIPGIMLVIAISLALDSRGVWVSFVAVGLTMWVDVARVVRGQFLSLKEKTYIEAGKVLGLPRSRLIFRHILPNLSGPLIVIATANFAAAILMEAGLSFLGLGVQPPAPSWGMMVNEGFQLIGAAAGLSLVALPSGCISILVLSFNLLGNGLRDAYDPQLLTGQA